MQVARLVASTHGRRQPFDVRPGDVHTLGRSSQCTVPIDDVKVSRQHCLLRLAGQHLVVEDLDSGNGVKFRGQRVANATLQPGDGFHIGYTFVQFEGWRTAPDPSPDPTPSGASAADLETADDFEIAAAAAALDAAAAAHPLPPGLEEAPPVPAGPTPAVGPAPRSPLAAATPQTAGEPFDDYADVASPRTPSMRRQASPQKRLAARLLAELIVFTTIWAVGIALLLVLKVMSPSCDIYRLLDWLRSLRG